MFTTIKHSRWLLALAVVLVAGQAFGHGMSDAERDSILGGGGPLAFLWLGTTHMLTGYDHLLFVFGIVFFLTRFIDIVKYITAFTLGHSVTLIAATFAGVQINYYLIDAVIGLSVAYIAFANLDGFRRLLDVKPPSLLVMITALGLIHGLGLSTRLQQLPLDPQHLLLDIVAFNVGVELGQAVALALMLALLAAWRKAPSFRPFSLAANYTLVAAGALLFLMQMHGYTHTTSPDDFGFAADNHFHEHMQLDEARIAGAAGGTPRETID